MGNISIFIFRLETNTYPQKWLKYSDKVFQLLNGQPIYQCRGLAPRPACTTPPSPWTPADVETLMSRRQNWKDGTGWYAIP